VKQPIEITVSTLLLLAAGGIFWRQANLPPEETAQAAKPAGIEQTCTTKCQAVAKELQCSRGDKCAELCGKLAAATVCKPFVERFIQCFAQVPSRGWRCEDDGTPMLGHFCEPEQNDISDCMMNNGRKL
jgi:hypothetical protein